MCQGVPDEVGREPKVLRKLLALGAERRGWVTAHRSRSLSPMTPIPRCLVVLRLPASPLSRLTLEPFANTAWSPLEPVTVCVARQPPLLDKKMRFSASDIWRRSQLILALCPKDIRWREKWVGCLLESLEQAPEDKQTSPFEELNRTGGVCLCAFVSSVLHLHQNSTCPIESTVPEVSSQQQRTCCAKSCVRFAIRTSMSVMSAARICVPSRLSSEDPYAALLEDCVLAPLSPPMAMECTSLQDRIGPPPRQLETDECNAAFQQCLDEGDLGDDCRKFQHTCGLHSPVLPCFSAGALSTTEVGNLCSAVRTNPRAFDEWLALIKQVETHGSVEERLSLYEAFLTEFPLCWGYWKRLAELVKKRRLLRASGVSKCYR
eukprot:s5979_g6.t1